MKNINPTSQINGVGFSMKKIDVKIKKSVGLLTKYIDAMIAYDTLKSDENYKYLEAVKNEWREKIAKINCESKK